MVHFNILTQKENLQLCLLFSFFFEIYLFCQQLFLMVDTLGSLKKPGL